MHYALPRGEYDRELVNELKLNHNVVIYLHPIHEFTL